MHREWYLRSALADRLGEDFALVQKDKLYRCLDRLSEHREALFDHLRRQGGELFEAQFDVLLYDLTSTYFESDPPAPETPGKRRFGYSRDHRPDCTQVVVALVVTPEGLPVAYEVYAGHTHEASTRDQLLLRLGAANKEAGRVWGLVKIRWPAADEAVDASTFGYELERDKLRQVRRREGRYLLRSNMRAVSPELVWENYLLLTRIEQAFKDLKGDLAVRPIYHQTDARIEAHIFVSFLAYCLHATLRNLARRHAGGLTVRAILEKLAGIAMIDVHLPTGDGREIVLSRYTEPEADVALLLSRLGLRLPGQSPPQVQAQANAGL